MASTFYHSFTDGLRHWALDNAQAELAPWLGRQALMLRSGFLPAPVEMEPPYTLRATVSSGPGECYLGFCFHLVDSENYETIYLAPQAGDRLTGIQYDPVMNGSNTWQVFGDADGLAAGPLQPPLRREHWHKLEVHVWADIAHVYVDDGPSPKAVFPLRSGLRQGRVGLWGYLPSYVMDFEMRQLAAPPPPIHEPKVAVPTGTVREWLVAQYDERLQTFVGPRRARSEHNGTLCLNRLFRAAPGARAIVACDIDLPESVHAALLELGYSDRARVWWDGLLVHEGEWRWDPPESDGRIRPGHTRAELPAAPGRHHLVAEVGVTEPAFGWGATARVVADGVPGAWERASTLGVPIGA